MKKEIVNLYPDQKCLFCGEKSPVGLKLKFYLDGELHMELSAKPLANPAVVCREILDGEAVLVNLDTAGSLALNPTGVVVWQLVDGQRTVEQIVAAVRRHFRDVPPTVADDVTALLDMLAEEGFVGFEWTPDDVIRDT